MSNPFDYVFVAPVTEAPGLCEGIQSILIVTSTTFCTRIVARLNRTIVGGHSHIDVLHYNCSQLCQHAPRGDGAPTTLLQG